MRKILSTRPGERLLERMSEEFEALLVREALREADGSIAAAARLLGVPRPTLHAKVQRHGIRVESRVDLPGGFDAEE